MFEELFETELDVLEAPWFLRAYDERVLDVAVNARTRRWLIVSTSPNIGEGQQLLNSGPFWAGSAECDKQTAFLEHVVALQNDGGKGVVPKPRNINQGRDGTGKFVRKSP